jgi:hypothetical protein
MKKKAFRGKRTAIAILFVVAALAGGYLMGRSSSHSGGPSLDPETGNPAERGAAVVPAGPEETAHDSPGLGTAAPALLVKPAAYDFGRIPQRTVTHDFRVKNRGDRPVTIREITTSCGCTTAEIDKRTLDPGGQATLTVRFDPKKHNTIGKVGRTVTLKIDDPARPITTIRLWASVYKTKKAAGELPAFAYNSAQTLEGYRIATRIPKVLEAIPCYCGCGKLANHRYLKDCFLNGDGSFDSHGSGCNLCDNEAIDVQKWLDTGMALPEIRRRIDEKYSQFGTPTPTPPVGG